MRLRGRHDSLLLAGFSVALLVVFERTIQYGLTMAQEIENTYGVTLLPALFILIVMLVFHQTANRREAKAEAAAAATEAATARARAAELEHLMLFGQGLARCLSIEALREMLWRHLPSLASDADTWVLLRHDNSTHQHPSGPISTHQDLWQRLTDIAESNWPAGEIERIADGVIAEPIEMLTQPDGIESDRYICFPLLVGTRPIGVVGVVTTGVTMDVRRKLGAATALLTVAIRNAQLFAEVRDSALKDALTGCYNRPHTIEVIETELARSRRSGGALSVVMFDVDRFKQINDQYGHACGDTVLMAVGQRIREVLRRSDVRCRYGGDEFLIVLPETGNDGANRVAEWLRGEIEQIVVAPTGERVQITISVGVSTAQAGDQTAATLIDAADRALYQAKAAGRNCVRTAALPPRAAVRPPAGASLRDAIAS